MYLRFYFLWVQVSLLLGFFSLLVKLGVLLLLVQESVLYICAQCIQTSRVDS
jgi:hypothetical protein